MYIRAQTLNVLTLEEVREINKVIINNSYKKCVGREKVALLEALSYFNWSSPSSVHLGHHSGRVSGSTLKKEIFFMKVTKELGNFSPTPGNADRGSN
ncbi:hypothetical protein [Paenibacillus sp. LjRoot153]|uniref:hypothetical protein n=1 Tax=Paenibacillus sp. LjRoot153 TaxID=3342270 RepID=UPI003F500277